jgi:hypothetical protein
MLRDMFPTRKEPLQACECITILSIALLKARMRVRRLGAYHGAGARAKRHRHGAPIAISDSTPAINEAHTRFFGVMRVGDEKGER